MSLIERARTHTVEAGDVPHLWWVTSGGSGKRYRVQIGWDDAGDVFWATCTCRYGRERGGSQPGCSHVLAAVREEVGG